MKIVTKSSTIDTDQIKTDIVDPAMKLVKATAKSSITRLTKDLVFQFPMIISGGIDTDEVFPMIKSFEKNYASIIQVAITAEGVIDRKRYASIVDFLKTIHNNDDIPFKAYEGLEDLTLTSSIACEGYLPTKDLLDMWDNVTEQLDESSINDMYLPYQRTAAKLSRAIESANMVALEADENKSTYFRRLVYKKNKDGTPMFAGSKENPIIQTDPKTGEPMYEYVKAGSQSSQKYAQMVSEYGSPKTLSDWNAAAPNIVKDELLSNINTARVGSEIVKDDKFNTLTPTIIKMTLANVSSSGAATWNQELVLGIRAMPHIIKPSLMITNMVQAFKDRSIFSFIKWTKGEVNLMDLILGISESKKLAKMDTKDSWLKVLKKRASRSKARFAGYKLNPNCTIVITDTEAYEIKNQCGIDPYNVDSVKKMMNKYFLLGFGIYDTEAKVLNILYESDRDYSQFPLRSMIADTKKESNLLAMNRY